MSQSKRGTIPINAVVEQFFVREHLNSDHVIYLAKLYESGTKLPPILVTREENKLIDGRHRLAALKSLEKKSVDVEWTDETDNGVILATALLANLGGALPPSNQDIVYAMSQMIEADMPSSVITKHFAAVWPPAVVRRYLQDAQSRLTKARVFKAKSAVIDDGMTVNDAAMMFKIRPDTLKSEIGGKKRKTGIAEMKSQLTNIFRSRGGSMGQIMRRMQAQYEDGDITWNTVDQVLEHCEKLTRGTLSSARDWRTRMEAKAGKSKKAVAK